VNGFLLSKLFDLDVHLKGLQGYQTQVVADCFYILLHVDLKLLKDSMVNNFFIFISKHCNLLRVFSNLVLLIVSLGGLLVKFILQAKFEVRTFVEKLVKDLDHACSVFVNSVNGFSFRVKEFGIVITC